jgi:hypothetical protein
MTTPATTSDLQSVVGIPLAQFNPASLNASYQVLNGNGLGNSAKILKLYNGSTTVSIFLSFDGVNDHDFMPPLGTCIIDFQTNHADGPIYSSGTWNVRTGQQIWGKLAVNPTWLQIIGYH